MNWACCTPLLFIDLPINFCCWGKRSMGITTIDKWEQRTADFARHFPGWESEYRSFF